MKYIEQRPEIEDKKISKQTRSAALRYLCDKFGTLRVNRRVYVRTEETDTTADGEVIDIAFRQCDYKTGSNIVPLYIITGEKAYYAGAWYDIVNGLTWYDYEFVHRTGMNWGDDYAEGRTD